MTYDDEYIRRILAEQKRMQDLVDQAMGGPNMRAMIESIKQFQEWKDNIPSYVGMTAKLFSEMRTALDTASGINISPTIQHVTQLFKEQQSLVNSAKNGLRPLLEHYELTRSALRPYFEHQQLANQFRINSSVVDSMQSIQAAIEDAMQFAKRIDTSTFPGMNVDELLSEF